jgi:hypothetical protein
MPGLFVLVAVAMALAQGPARTSTQASQLQSAGGASQSANTGSAAANQVTANQATTPESTLAVPAATQDTSVPNSDAGVDRVVAGTEIRAALDTPLSTRTSKPGDRFTASITDPVRANDSTVVIPGGARIEGEVAEAEEGKTVAALRGKSTLSLRFRNVVMPNGQTLPLIATLISVHDTSGRSAMKVDQGKNAAKDVGIGTSTGLVFGGPLKGLAIGTLAGGGYVLSIKGKDVNLPAQTGMVIRLDQPISGNGASAPPQR